MIKDDLSPLKMSEKKIKTLLHELQDEGQIKFDPRKAKPGKM
jgi:MarR-like DNA-binding transcriptional regulator SgrR of sgrS sRNA